MFEYQGKYARAFIWADGLEQTCMTQVIEFCNHPAFTNDIHMMEDAHAGKGVPVGFTTRLGPRIVPNLIGVDIGCGVKAVVLDFALPSKKMDFKLIDERIREVIPLGQNIHYKYNEYKQYEPLLLVNGYDDSYFDSLCNKIGVDKDYVINSIGTLGGGNHFIEIGFAEQTGKTILTIHSGSRNFGLKIAQYYQKLAEACHPESKTLAWLEDDLAAEYLKAMTFAQRYAEVNRLTIAHRIAEMALDTSMSKYVDSIHNYIRIEDQIIRKGAVSAHANEEIIVPMNMAFGSLVLKTIDASKRNFSAPHGAGRVYSRSKAKKELNLQEFQKQMEDVYSSCICAKTLDEAPKAYKDPLIIMASLSDTFSIVDRIKPKYVLKG